MDAVGGQWAGTFACSVCRRERLTAASFSATQLRKLRAGKVGEDGLRCLECVSVPAEAARTHHGDGGGGELICGVCGTLPRSAFSNAQAAKSDDVRRCRTCVASAEKREAEAAAARRLERASAHASAHASAQGATARMHAAAAECAAEAELVTGLKPVRGSTLRRGRGRGRGRARGSWRARARGRAPH